MITAVQKELIVGLAEKLHGMSELNYEKDCSKRHYEKENLKGYIYKRAAEPDYPVRNSHLQKITFSYIIVTAPYTIDS